MKSRRDTSSQLIPGQKASSSKHQQGTRYKVRKQAFGAFFHVAELKHVPVQLPGKNAIWAAHLPGKERRPVFELLVFPFQDLTAFSLFNAKLQLAAPLKVVAAAVPFFPFATSLVWFFSSRNGTNSGSQTSVHWWMISPERLGNSHAKDICLGNWYP